MHRLPARADGPRLVLRRWTPDDVDLLATVVTANLDHLRPWMPWVAAEPLDRDARLRLLREWDEDWRAGGDVGFGAFAEADVVGGCGLHRRRGRGVLEIGYWVHVDHVGRGYGREMAALATDAAFTVPGIRRVEIHHDRANVRSRRIPESLGFRCDGETPDECVAPAEVGIDVAWSMQRARWPQGWSDGDAISPKRPR